MLLVLSMLPLRHIGCGHWVLLNKATFHISKTHHVAPDFLPGDGACMRWRLLPDWLWNEATWRNCDSIVTMKKRGLDRRD